MVVTLPLPPVYSPHIHENVYENVVCEMATILSMGGGGGGGGGMGQLTNMMLAYFS